MTRQLAEKTIEDFLKQHSEYLKSYKLIENYQEILGGFEELLGYTLIINGKKISYKLFLRIDIDHFNNKSLYNKQDIFLIKRALIEALTFFKGDKNESTI